MLKNACRGCCVFGLIVTSYSALADLTSQTYKMAKDAYERNDCNAAIYLLEQYKDEDKRFLNEHEQIENDIDHAILYCNKYIYRLTHHFTGDSSGVEKESGNGRKLSSKPNLP